MRENLLGKTNPILKTKIGTKTSEETLLKSDKERMTNKSDLFSKTTAPGSIVYLPPHMKPPQGLAIVKFLEGFDPYMAY